MEGMKIWSIAQNGITDYLHLEGKSFLGVIHVIIEDLKAPIAANPL